jgi:hypothetical protein
MANITINDLQPVEFAELSDLELEAIVGGKKSPLQAIIKSPLQAITIQAIGRKIDQGVRKNVPGGWVAVVKTGIDLLL